MPDHLFSRMLKQLRDAQDLTQEALAEQVGCAVTTISAIERGRRRPSRAMAERLAEILAVAPSELPEFLRLARTQIGASEEQGDEVVDDGFDSPAEANPAQPARRLQLPLPGTALIGRALEEAELCRRLLDPACRLLTITGAGGTGKTRLALQVAADLHDHFADGVAFVALAPLMVAEHVAATVADGLGCSLLATQTAEESLLQFLHKRELLLVLDNAEHLLSMTPLLVAVLRAAPGVRLLVTSRERLRVQEEWVFALGGLATPRDTSREAIEHSDAVLLFLERARRVVGAFALTSTNRAAVGQICHLLDGIPLGLELAAAWTRMLTPEEIAVELTRGLDFLQLNDRDADPRHHSMRAVIDHSWALLTPNEQRVMVRLAVFRGGCTREAVESVAGATLPVLVALIDKSLLRRTAEGRYELHELVRQYAQEQSDEGEAAQRQHAVYYLALAEQAGPGLKGQDQKLWLPRLEVELDNLRAALEWSIAHGAAESIARTAWASWQFWWWSGHLKEGRHWMEETLKRVPDLPALVRARLLFVSGTYSQALADWEPARVRAEESLRLFRQLGDEEGMAYALGTSGIVALGQERPAAGLALLEESVELNLKVGDKWGASLLLGLTAPVAIAQGDFARAGRLAEQALALAQEIGSRDGVYVALLTLATVAWVAGEHERATERFKQGLALSVEVGEASHVAYCLEGLAAVGASVDASPAGAVRAVRLWGAAAALLAQIEVIAYTYTAVRALFQAQMTTVRTRVDQTSFATAWAEGQAMTTEQVVAYVLVPDNP